MQDVVHDGEKVKKPSIGQSRSNGGMGIAFAQLLIADVWMRHILARGRRMRVKGNHIIGKASAQVTEPIYTQLDAKWAEIDAFERNRPSRNRDAIVLLIELDKAEFLLQRLQFRNQKR
jgi:hypothetical protein